MKKRLLSLKVLFYALTLTGISATAQDAALKFDQPTGTYIQTNVAPPVGAENRTIEMWIKGASVSALQDVAVYGTFSAGQRFSFVSLSGKLRLETGGTGNGVSSTATILDNTWHHIATTVEKVTATTAKVILYVDGVKDGESTFTVNTTIGTTGANLHIGSRYNGTTNAFTGIIDDVRVWNVARTQAEIQGSMSKEMCTYPQGLLAYFKLNEGAPNASNKSVNYVVNQIAPTDTGNLVKNFTMTGTSANFVSGKVGINNAVTSDNTTLTATQTGATYKWLDADNANAPIPNATGQSFTPQVNGNYAVEITLDGCTKTSAPIAFNTSLGMNDNVFERSIQLYPNPTNNHFNVNLGDVFGNVKVKLLSVTGSVIAEKSVSNANSFQMDINQAAGLYFLNITTDTGKSAVLKVVKQ